MDWEPIAPRSARERLVEVVPRAVFPGPWGHVLSLVAGRCDRLLRRGRRRGCLLRILLCGYRKRGSKSEDGEFLDHGPTMFLNQAAGNRPMDSVGPGFLS